MNKTTLKYFVSYAHKTSKSVSAFLDTFEDHLNLSTRYKFEKWIDRDIIVGDGWNQQIQEAATGCDFGLLLLSASYFNRSYIREHELPHFIKNNEILKPIVPVGIEVFSLNGDLLGLEATQIFLHQCQVGMPQRFYSELRGVHREHFVRSLVEKLVYKLDKL
jgi:TIR domain